MMIEYLLSTVGASTASHNAGHANFGAEEAEPRTLVGRDHYKD
jgi:hypothetical protein